MTRYHLLAETSDGEHLEVDLFATDAAAAVHLLAELVQRGQEDQERHLVRVHARPVDD